MRRKSVLIILTILFLAMEIYAQNREGNNVLIINSTHQGSTFSDRYLKGIEGVLNKSKQRINLYIEYLDLLRVPQTQNQINSLANFLKKKYEGISFDVIIGTDDEGLSFAQKFREMLNTDIPIVFCAALPENEEKISKMKNVFGTYFEYDFENNFNFTKSIFPDRKKYIIIHDSSGMARYVENSIKKLESKFPEIQFSYLNSRTLEENINFINAIADDAVVFPTIFYKDRLGNVYYIEQFTNLLHQYVNAPLIGFLDYQANRGVVGGYLYVGYKEGRRAGEIAEYIINKKPIPTQLFREKFRFNSIIGYSFLEQYNIPKSSLPKDIVIANRPATYLEKYNTVLIPYVSLILSLLVFLVILIINTRKRNKITKQLHDNEELFRLLTENAKDVIFRFEIYPSPHFKYVSPSVKDVMGIEPSELYQDLSKFTSILKPEDLQIFREVINGNYNFINNLEQQWYLPNKVIWTESKFHPIYDENKTLIAFEGVTRVTTEHKQTLETLRQNEERLTLVLAATKDGIWDWNIPDGNLIIDNRWSALSQQDEKIFLSYTDMVKRIIHPEDLESASKVIDDYLSKKTDHYESEFRIKISNGEYVWILSKGKIIEYDEKDNPIRMIGTLRDISDKKKNEQEILKIQKLESLGTLAGGIAHDFNNILTSILGNISLSKILLLKEKGNEKIISLLNNSEKSTYKAKELTQKLLSFSRGGNPVKKPLDPEKLLNEIAQISVQGYSTKIETKYLTNPWYIEADEGQLKHTFQSIILNAIESMNGEGLVKVIVRNYTVNRQFVNNPALLKDHYLRIDIIDQGCGISRENLDKVFDPYFTTKSKSGGLGLSSAYTVIKNHNGHILISSVVDKGSTVTIYLPAYIESVKTKSEQKRRAKSSTPKILVMDDDDFIRELLNEALTNFGYEVDMTIDGDEAISKYTEKFLAGIPYDLVIMDLTIPGGKGGKETIIELKALDPDITALVSSGYSNDPILSNYEEYGFSGIITKPYNIDMLKETLKNILG